MTDKIALQLAEDMKCFNFAFGKGYDAGCKNERRHWCEAFINDIDRGVTTKEIRAHCVKALKEMEE